MIKRPWKFGVFILSHGRAETITTYDMMRKYNYTGDMWVVIDNEDDQEQKYRDRFGSAIIQFDKRDYLSKTDTGDLEDNRKVGVFARNFIQDKAKEMGYDFHLQLDDDIFEFSYRFVGKDGKLKCKRCTRLDEVLDAMCQYMYGTKITALSFGAPIYYPGGVDNGMWKQQMIHKTMTVFLLRADDINYFNMRMNDDITTSALNTSRGKLYYTYMPIMINTERTQGADGGMTEIYVDNGTYWKSFYTVMALPSCTKVASMGVVDKRVHHEIRWGNCAPKLISEIYRKPREAVADAKDGKTQNRI